MAEELGVWDEFYGSGKEGKRKAKKNQDKDKEQEDDGEAVLKALIQKRQKKLDGFLDNLAEKYGAMEENPKKSKKRNVETELPTVEKTAKKNRKR